MMDEIKKDEIDVEKEFGSEHAEGVLDAETVKDVEAAAEVDVETLKKKEKKRLSEQDKRKVKQASIQQQIEALQKEQAKLLKELSDNRGACLKKFQSAFYKTMMQELGFRR